MKKEINFILEKEDFKKSSGVSKETIQNMLNSFRNYLKIIDIEKKIDKKITLKELTRDEKLVTNQCVDIIRGDMMTISDDGTMTSINTTEKIIVRLVDIVNKMVLIRNRIKELEK